MKPDLHELAARHGVAASYLGPMDRTVTVPDATLVQVLTALGVDVADGLPDDQIAMPAMTARAGTRCYLPEWLDNGGAWGIAVQLYELRSSRNWGIGDFADLTEFCRLAAKAGADFVGLNPLHALMLAEPERCSPFSPSNRRFLNPLYIAVDALPGFHSDDADTAAMEAARARDLVDYAAVAELKLAALSALWRRSQENEPEPPFDQASFEHFKSQGGEALARHAHLEADRLRSSGQADTTTEDAAFHIWLQWIADTQLRQAAAAAKDAGMRIGLYLDFAVGETPDGTAVAGSPELYVPGMSVGAPPDYFTSGGQDWGLAPPSPRALAFDECTRWRALMGSVMRHAGALRIDHAMSLWQLFFVPHDATPAEGCYVRYPTADLLQVLAELSREHGTIVIGEDLGHVPEGFRDLMEEVAILSYRILYFEMNESGFLPPEDYPRMALACLSTHDLPTLAGWWRGSDIDLRHEHELIDTEAAEAQQAERRPQRDALLVALRNAQAVSPAAVERIEAAVAEPTGDLPQELVVAAHRYMAKSAAALVAIRLADLVGEARPTNLPGTIDSYPNWRLKLAVPLEALADHSLFSSVTAAMRAERPRRP